MEEEDQGKAGMRKLGIFLDNKTLPEDLEMETFFSITRKPLIHYLLEQYKLGSKAEVFHLAAH